MTLELIIPVVVLLVSSAWSFYAMRDSELSMFLVGASYMLATVFIMKVALAVGDAYSGFVAVSGLVPSTSMIMYAIAKFIEDYRLERRIRVVPRGEEVQGGQG